MTEPEEKSPYGPGFIAACITLTAILACGALLLFTAPSTTPTSANPTCPDGATTGTSADGGVAGGSPSADSSAAGGQSECGAGEPEGGAAGDGSAGGVDQPSTAGSGQPSTAASSLQDPSQSSQQGATPGTPQPAGEAVALPSGSTSTGSSGGTASSCGLTDGDQATPSSQPPKADLWEVSRRVVVPRSSAYGPGKTDSDGFRRCFAHSPTGAVYAAYNVIAALADQTKIIPTATKLMVPGRNTDLLLQEVRKETPDTASTPAQVAGYRIVDADRDRVTIMLAMPVQTEFMSATFTLTWHAGDWRLVPPPNAGDVGAPYSQHHNLNDFVEWSGV
ncbi:hypothetical protein [Kribbella sp. NPDC051620]|uniref:hypothetical protein n=1 Tax=Kribbella sp. NPDC051620 TaxID=3364120 RepID=UPI0037B810A7